MALDIRFTDQTALVTYHCGRHYAAVATVGGSSTHHKTIADAVAHLATLGISEV